MQVGGKVENKTAKTNSLIYYECLWPLSWLIRLVFVINIIKQPGKNVEQIQRFQQKNLFSQLSLKIHNCLVFDKEGSSCFQSLPEELFPILLSLFSSQTHVGFHEVCVSSIIYKTVGKAVKSLLPTYFSDGLCEVMIDRRWQAAGLWWSRPRALWHLSFIVLKESCQRWSFRWRCLVSAAAAVDALIDGRGSHGVWKSKARGALVSPISSRPV